MDPENKSSNMSSKPSDGSWRLMSLLQSLVSFSPSSLVPSLDQKNKTSGLDVADITYLMGEEYIGRNMFKIQGQIFVNLHIF